MKAKDIFSFSQFIIISVLLLSDFKRKKNQILEKIK